MLKYLEINENSETEPATWHAVNNSALKFELLLMVSQE
jgi:hypothetical protein